MKKSLVSVEYWKKCTQRKIGSFFSAPRCRQWSVSARSDDAEYHLRVHRLLDALLRRPPHPHLDLCERSGYSCRSCPSVCVCRVHIWTEYRFVIADSVYAFAETLALLNSATNSRFVYGTANICGSRDQHPVFQRSQKFYNTLWETWLFLQLSSWTRGQG